MHPAAPSCFVERAYCSGPTRLGSPEPNQLAAERPDIVTGAASPGSAAPLSGEMQTLERPFGYRGGESARTVFVPRLSRLAGLEVEGLMAIEAEGQTSSWGSGHPKWVGAFNAYLLGIDLNRRTHVAGRLLALRDGPVLESLKQLRGARLREPRRALDTPDRDRLAQRFEIFLSLNYAG